MQTNTSLKLKSSFLFILSTIFFTGCVNAKIDLAKALQRVLSPWAAQVGSSAAPSTVSAQRSVVDSAGNIYLVLSHDVRLYSSIQNDDPYCFVAKYNSTGTQQWIHQQGISTTSCTGITIDEANSALYVAGSTKTAVDNQTLHGSKDFFVSKFDLSGSRAWTIQNGVSSATVTAQAVQADSTGDIYVIGTTNAAIDGQSLHGTTDAFVSKFNSSGVRQWTLEDGVAAGNTAGVSLSLDGSHGLYILGSADGPIDGQATTSGFNYFISKYDASGARVWTTEDAADDSGGIPLGTVPAFEVSDISVTPTGVITVAGNSSLDIDGTSGTSFISQYNSSGAHQWTSRPTANSLVEVRRLAVDSSGNAYMTGIVFNDYSTNGTGMYGAPIVGNYDFYLNKFDPSGALIWSVQHGAANTSAYANSISIDSSGNAIVGGLVIGATFDSQASVGTEDILLTKYNSAGTRQWTTRSNSSIFRGSTLGNRTGVDDLGNMYVAGATTGPIGSQNMHGTQDFFINKFDKNGALVWTVQNGAVDAIITVSGFAVDASGNTYVAGTTSGSLDSQSTHGDTDFYLTKYNSAGVRQWTVQDGSGMTLLSGLALDQSSSIYLAGGAAGSLDGQTDYALSSTVQGNTIYSYDHFVTKYNSAGVRQWTSQGGRGGVGSDTRARALAIDSSGNVYITGTTIGSLDGQPHTGSSDLYIKKYDSTGAHVWTVEDGVASGTTIGLAIAATTDGILISGATDHGFDGQTLLGTTDLFLTKYSASGTRDWTTEDGVATKAVTPHALAVSSTGSIYIVGETTGALDAQTLTGSTDGFITTYDTNGVRQTTALIGATSSATKALDVTSDIAGNLYITGSIDMSSSGGSPLSGQTAKGFVDAFIKRN